MNILELLLANLVVIVGSALQGSIGFGLGFVGAPLLMLIDPGFIPGPLLVAAVVLTMLLAHRERHAIVYSELKWAISGRVIGVIVATSVIASVSVDALGLILGIVVLVLVSLCFSGLRMSPNPSSLIVAGTASGFTGTIVSVGAPPMAVVYQNESGPRIRGTLNAFFVVGTVMSLSALAFVGRFGWHEVRYAASILPGILIGFFLSKRLAEFLDKGYMRNAVLAFSAVGGLVLVLREMF